MGATPLKGVVSISRLVICWRGLALRLTAMPVLGEQVEEDLPTRMRGDDIVVERHAQARPARQREVTVDNLRIARRRSLHEVLREIVEVFLDLEVGGARG